MRTEQEIRERLKEVLELRNPGLLPSEIEYQVEEAMKWYPLIMKAYIHQLKE